MKKRKCKGKKGEFGVGGIVMLMILIVIGLALLPSIANEQSKLTTKQTITNDSITYTGLSGANQINTSLQFNVTKAQSDWRSTECPLSSYTFTNSSGTAYTETTDYVFTPAYGNFTLKNTAKVNASMASDNKTYVSYTYCDAGYNKDAGARGIANLLTLFAALGLFAAVVWYLYKESDLF